MKNILTGYDVKTATLSANKIATNLTFDRSPYVPLAAQARGYTIRDGRTKEVVSDFNNFGGTLFYDGKYLWTGGSLNSGINYLTQINLIDLTFTSVAMGDRQYVQGIAFDGEFIWANTKNNLVKVNRDANTVISSTDVTGTIALGGLIYDQNGSLWMGRVSPLGGPSKVYKYNISTATFSVFNTFFGNTGTFASDGSYIYVAGTNAILHRININSLSTESLALNGSTSQVRFDGSLIWVISNGVIDIVRPSTFTIKDTLSDAAFHKFCCFDGNYIQMSENKIDTRTLVVSTAQLRIGASESVSLMEYDGVFVWIVAVTDGGFVSRIRRFLA
jgi:hypothetical protein